MISQTEARGRIKDWPLKSVCHCIKPLCKSLKFCLLKVTVTLSLSVGQSEKDTERERDRENEWFTLRSLSRPLKRLRDADNNTDSKLFLSVLGVISVDVQGVDVERGTYYQLSLKCCDTHWWATHTSAGRLVINCHTCPFHSSNCWKLIHRRAFSSFVFINAACSSLKTIQKNGAPVFVYENDTFKISNNCVWHYLCYSLNVFLIFFINLIQ